MAGAVNSLLCCFDFAKWRYRYRRYRAKRATDISSEPVTSGKHATTTTTFSKLQKTNEERVKRLTREGVIHIPKDKAKIVERIGISPAPSYTSREVILDEP